MTRKSRERGNLMLRSIQGLIYSIQEYNYHFLCAQYKTMHIWCSVNSKVLNIRRMNRISSGEERGKSIIQKENGMCNNMETVKKPTSPL